MPEMLDIVKLDIDSVAWDSIVGDAGASKIVNNHLEVIQIRFGDRINRNLADS